MRALTVFASAVLAAALACGCRAISIDLVKVGHSGQEVKWTAGRPLRIERGEDVEVGLDKWYYSEGIVHFRAGHVCRVEKYDAPEPKKKSAPSRYDRVWGGDGIE